MGEKFKSLIFFNSIIQNSPYKNQLESGYTAS